MPNMADSADALQRYHGQLVEQMKEMNKHLDCICMQLTVIAKLFTQSPVDGIAVDHGEPTDRSK